MESLSVDNVWFLMHRLLLRPRPRSGFRPTATLARDRRLCRPRTWSHVGHGGYDTGANLSEQTRAASPSERDAAVWKRALEAMKWSVDNDHNPGVGLGRTGAGPGRIFRGNNCGCGPRLLGCGAIPLRCCGGLGGPSLLHGSVLPRDMTASQFVRNSLFRRSPRSGFAFAWVKRCCGAYGPWVPGCSATGGTHPRGSSASLAIHRHRLPAGPALPPHPPASSATSAARGGRWHPC
jgi:hypothetical protein